MFENYAREMLDLLLRTLEDVPSEVSNVRDLRLASNYEGLREHLVYRLTHELDRRPMPWRWREEYDRVQHRQGAQLDRIERLLSNRTEGCRFAEGRDGGPWFAELMTMKPSADNYISPSAGNDDADPESFIVAVGKMIRKTTTVVLMDPYALTPKNDSNDDFSTIQVIKDIVSHAHNVDLGPVHLHLYCRAEAIDYDEWDKLNTSLKPHKLSVYVGDFHDRYILFGQDRPVDGSDLTDNWHGMKYWGGMAFGSSLNGIAKRPTYVLGLKKVDILPLIAYIRGVVSTSGNWQTLKDAQEKRDKEKRALAEAKREEERQALRQEIMAEMAISAGNSPIVK